jgi:hypothetical protein
MMKVTLCKAKQSWIACQSVSKPDVPEPKAVNHTNNKSDTGELKTKRPARQKRVQVTSSPGRRDSIRNANKLLHLSPDASISVNITPDCMSLFVGGVRNGRRLCLLATVSHKVATNHLCVQKHKISIYSLNEKEMVLPNELDCSQMCRKGNFLRPQANTRDDAKTDPEHRCQKDGTHA